MITKMHFERAAAIVKSVLHDDYFFQDIEVETASTGNINPALFVARRCCESFVTLFREFNPRFNAEKFYRACGLSEDK